VVRVDPNELVFTLGVLTSVPILVKKNEQEIRSWECPQRDTQWHTDRRNRFLANVNSRYAVVRPFIVYRL